MDRQRGLILWMVMALALCLAACSPDRPAETTLDETPAETLDETADVAGQAGPERGPISEGAAETPEVQPESIPAPEGVFAGASAALEGLASYRYTTTFLFVGEDNGEVESGSIEITGAIVGADRKHLTWRNLADNEEFQLIQVENVAWISAGVEWEEVPILVAEAMSQAVLSYAPSVAWGGLFGELESSADYVGKDVVNEISSYHYTSTYKQWGGYWQGELIDASGDVWIAEAGYPVKYHFAATGVDEEGDRGSVTWTMELFDANRPIEIEPPM